MTAPGQWLALISVTVMPSMVTGSSMGRGWMRSGGMRMSYLSRLAVTALQ